MVNTLIEAIVNDIENLFSKITTLPKSNLSIQETEALKELANRDDLFISKADKGGAIVIQTIDSYIQEASLLNCAPNSSLTRVLRPCAPCLSLIRTCAP